MSKKAKYYYSPGESEAIFRPRNFHNDKEDEDQGWPGGPDHFRDNYILSDVLLG